MNKKALLPLSGVAKAVRMAEAAAKAKEPMLQQMVPVHRFTATHVWAWVEGPGGAQILTKFTHAKIKSHKDSLVPPTFKAFIAGKIDPFVYSGVKDIYPVDWQPGQPKGELGEPVYMVFTQKGLPTEVPSKPPTAAEFGPEEFSPDGKGPDDDGWYHGTYKGKPASLSPSQALVVDRQNVPLWPKDVVPASGKEIDDDIVPLGTMDANGRPIYLTRDPNTGEDMTLSLLKDGSFGRLSGNKYVVFKRDHEGDFVKTKNTVPASGQKVTPQAPPPAAAGSSLEPIKKPQATPTPLPEPAPTVAKEPEPAPPPQAKEPEPEPAPPPEVKPSLPEPQAKAGVVDEPAKDLLDPNGFPVGATAGAAMGVSRLPGAVSVFGIWDADIQRYAITTSAGVTKAFFVPVEPFRAIAKAEKILGQFTPYRFDLGVRAIYLQNDSGLPGVPYHGNAYLIANGDIVVKATQDFYELKARPDGTFDLGVHYSASDIHALASKDNMPWKYQPTPEASKHKAKPFQPQDPNGYPYIGKAAQKVSKLPGGLIGAWIDDQQRYNLTHLDGTLAKGDTLLPLSIFQEFEKGKISIQDNDFFEYSHINLDGAIVFKGSPHLSVYALIAGGTLTIMDPSANYFPVSFSADGNVITNDADKISSKEALKRAMEDGASWSYVPYAAKALGVLPSQGEPEKDENGYPVNEKGWSSLPGGDYGMWDAENNAYQLFDLLTGKPRDIVNLAAFKRIENKAAIGAAVPMGIDSNGAVYYYTPERHLFLLGNGTLTVFENGKYAPIDLEANVVHTAHAIAPKDVRTMAIKGTYEFTPFVPPAPPKPVTDPNGYPFDSELEGVSRLPIASASGDTIRARWDEKQGVYQRVSYSGVPLGKEEGYSVVTLGHIEFYKKWAGKMLFASHGVTVKLDSLSSDGSFSLVPAYVFESNKQGIEGDAFILPNGWFTIYGTQKGHLPVDVFADEVYVNVGQPISEDEVIAMSANKQLTSEWKLIYTPYNTEMPSAGKDENGLALNADGETSTVKSATNEPVTVKYDAAKKMYQVFAPKGGVLTEVPYAAIQALTSNVQIFDWFASDIDSNGAIVLAPKNLGQLGTPVLLPNGWLAAKHEPNGPYIPIYQKDGEWWLTSDQDVTMSNGAVKALSQFPHAKWQYVQYVPAVGTAPGAATGTSAIPDLPAPPKDFEATGEMDPNGFPEYKHKSGMGISFSLLPQGLAKWMFGSAKYVFVKPSPADAKGVMQTVDHSKPSVTPEQAAKAAPASAPTTTAEPSPWDALAGIPEGWAKISDSEQSTYQAEVRKKFPHLMAVANPQVTGLSKLRAVFDHITGQVLAVASIPTATDQLFAPWDPDAYWFNFKDKSSWKTPKDMGWPPAVTDASAPQAEPAKTWADVVPTPKPATGKDPNNFSYLMEIDGSKVSLLPKNHYGIWSPTIKAYIPVFKNEGVYSKSTINGLIYPVAAIRKLKRLKPIVGKFYALAIDENGAVVIGKKGQKQGTLRLMPHGTLTKYLQGKYKDALYNPSKDKIELAPGTWAVSADWVKKQLLKKPQYDYVGPGAELEDEPKFPSELQPEEPALVPPPQPAAQPQPSTAPEALPVATLPNGWATALASQQAGWQELWVATYPHLKAVVHANGDLGVFDDTSATVYRPMAPESDNFDQPLNYWVYTKEAGASVGQGVGWTKVVTKTPAELKWSKAAVAAPTTGPLPAPYQFAGPNTKLPDIVLNVLAVYPHLKPLEIVVGSNAYAAAALFDSISNSIVDAIGLGSDSSTWTFGAWKIGTDIKLIGSAWPQKSPSELGWPPAVLPKAAPKVPYGWTIIPPVGWQAVHIKVYSHLVPVESPMNYALFDPKSNKVLRPVAAYFSEPNIGTSYLVWNEYTGSSEDFIGPSVSPAELGWVKAAGEVPAGEVKLPEGWVFLPAEHDWQTSWAHVYPHLKTVMRDYLGGLYDSLSNSIYRPNDVYSNPGQGTGLRKWLPSNEWTPGAVVTPNELGWVPATPAGAAEFNLPKDWKQISPKPGWQYSAVKEFSNLIPVEHTKYGDEAVFDPGTGKVWEPADLDHATQPDSEYIAWDSSVEAWSGAHKTVAELGWVGATAAPTPAAGGVPAGWSTTEPTSWQKLHLDVYPHLVPVVSGNNSVLAFYDSKSGKVLKATGAYWNAPTADSTYAVWNGATDYDDDFEGAKTPVELGWVVPKLPEGWVELGGDLSGETIPVPKEWQELWIAKYPHLKPVWIEKWDYTGVFDSKTGKVYRPFIGILKSPVPEGELRVWSTNEEDWQASGETASTLGWDKPEVGKTSQAAEPSVAGLPDNWTVDAGTLSEKAKAAVAAFPHLVAVVTGVEVGLWDSVTQKLVWPMDFPEDNPSGGFDGDTLFKFLNPETGNYDPYAAPFHASEKWGAGTVPAAPPASQPAVALPAGKAPKLAASAMAAKLPKASALKFVKSGSGMGGAGTKDIYADSTGKEYLFKHATSKSGGKVEEFRAYAQEVFAAVATQVRPDDHPPIATIKLKGVVGTIQPMLQLSPNQNLAAPSSLSENDKVDIANDHLLDWLNSQHDSHKGNWLRLANGRLISVDKEQGFKHWGKDELSTDYHPNAVHGEAPPYYNMFWDAFASGNMDFQPQVMLPALERIEKIDGAQLREVALRYAEAKAPQGTAYDKEAFAAEYISRRNTLRRDFEKFITEQYRKREKDDKGVFTFAKGWISGKQTTVLKEVSVKEQLKQGGFKVQDHASKHELLLLKVPMHGPEAEQKLKDKIAELGLSIYKESGEPGGEVFKGAANYKAYVLRAEFEKLPPKTVEVPIVQGGTADHPGKATYLPVVKLATAADPNYEELKTIESSKSLGQMGRRIYLDSDAVEGQTASVRRVKKDGKVFYRVIFKITAARQKGITGPKAAYDLGQGSYQSSDDLIHLSGGAPHNVATYEFEDGDNRLYVARPEDYQAFRGMAIAEIHSGGVESSLKKLLGKIGLASAIMKNPKPEEIEIVKKLRLYKMTAPQDHDTFIATPGNITLPKIDAALAKAGITQALVDRIREAEVLPGHVSHVIPGQWRELHQQSDGTPSIRYAFQGGNAADGVAKVLRSALIGANERLYGGAPFSTGAVNAGDLSSGGSDTTQLRVSTVNTANSPLYLPGTVSGYIRYIVAPDIFDRTDLVMHMGDKYGASTGVSDHHYNSYATAYKTRKSLKAAIAAYEKGASKSSKTTGFEDAELVVPRGVHTNKLLRVACETEDLRKEALSFCREAGVEEHNGVPIEDFIVVETKQGPVYDKYVKPAGY